MALVRWSPNRRSPSTIRNSRDDLECFLEDFFGYRPWGNGTAAASFAPRVDLRDTPEAFVLRAEVPGVSKDELEVTITPDVVTLKGERKDETLAESDCYYCRESVTGRFERTVPLPQPVVSDKAEAKLQDGVLTISLPKAQPKTAIKINVS